MQDAKAKEDTVAKMQGEFETARKSSEEALAQVQAELMGVTQDAKTKEGTVAKPKANRKE